MLSLADLNDIYTLCAICTGQYKDGCQAFKRLSPNIEKDMSIVEEYLEMLDDTYTEVGVTMTAYQNVHIFTNIQHDLISLLENNVRYLHIARRHSVAAEVLKLLQPFNGGKSLSEEKPWQLSEELEHTVDLTYYYRVSFFGEVSYLLNMVYKILV